MVMDLCFHLDFAVGTYPKQLIKDQVFSFKLRGCQLSSHLYEFILQVSPIQCTLNSMVKYNCLRMHLILSYLVSLYSLNQCSHNICDNKPLES